MRSVTFVFIEPLCHALQESEKEPSHGELRTRIWKILNFFINSPSFFPFFSSCFWRSYVFAWPLGNFQDCFITEYFHYCATFRITSFLQLPNITFSKTIRLLFHIYLQHFLIQRESRFHLRTSMGINKDFFYIIL